MRALVQLRNGPPEVLQVKEWPDPVAGPGEVRIRVRACGLNFADVQARVGLYPDAPRPPCVLGYEVAGEIESVGPGVSGIEVGARVTAPTRFGGFAELAVTDARNLVEIPTDLGFPEAAAVPVVYGTAYEAVMRLGNVQRGERILVHAAAGGVGIAAIQLARHRGAEILGTASAAKHEAIRAQGVAHAIDYRAGDVAGQVRRTIGHGGLDVVLDPRGGRGFRESYDLLRPGGRLVLYGVNEMVAGERRDLLRVARTWLLTPTFSTFGMMSQSKSVLGVNMLRLWDDRGSLADFVKPLAGLIAEGAVSPLVAETFSLERAAEAHRFLQERRNIGKVVLTVT